MEIKVSTYQSEDLSAIESFLAETPAACVFQCPQYFEALRAVRGKRAHYFVARDGAGVVCGVLLCELMSQRFDPLAWFTGILDIKGGPVVRNNDPEIITALLDAAKALRPRPLYMQIAPIFDPAPIKDCILNYGFEFRPHLSLTIDLSKSEEELWQAMAKDRRKSIQKAVSNGLRFTELETEQEIDEFIDIVRHTYKRLKIPMLELDVIKGLRGFMPKNVAYFGIRNSEGKIVSGQLAFVYKDLFYCYIMGSIETSHSAKPNELSYWEAIKWAKRNGYKIFDMGGGGNPEKPYGVRDYKMRFAPDARNYGHYLLPLRPKLLAIAKKSYYLLYRR